MRATSSPISSRLEAYLKSGTWRRRRAQYLRSVGHQCEECGAGRYLTVHHLDYTRLDGLERDADLQCLCITCHSIQHPNKPVRCGPFTVTYNPDWGMNGGSRIEEYPF